MGRPTIILDCTWLPPPDLGQVELLARLLLVARRGNYDLRLAHASAALLELIAFAGLGEALRREPGGQTEEREQPLGVEEEGELDDLSG